jgi:hypothetical protein
MDLLREIFRVTAERECYVDFGRRYNRGHPADGYSDNEVLTHYHEVSELLSPSVYCRMASAALDRLTPVERRAFSRIFVQVSRSYCGPSIRQSIQSSEMVDTDDVSTLATRMAELQRRQPGALGQALRKEVEHAAPLGRPTKAVLAGITAFGIEHFLED